MAVPLVVFIDGLSDALHHVLLFLGASVHARRSVIEIGLCPIDVLALKKLMVLADSANIEGSYSLGNEAVIQHLIRATSLLNLLDMALLLSLPAHPTNPRVLQVLGKCAMMLGGLTFCAGESFSNKGPILYNNLIG